MPEVDFDLSRGQSEVLGFVFVFGIVVTTVAIVSATGYVELRDARDFQRVNNAEQGFDLLASNVDDLVDARASSRTTELELDSAKLTFGEPITVSVNGTEADGGGGTFNLSYSVRPFVYDAGETRILYVAGAVIREEQSGALLVRPPPMVLSGQHTVIPVISVERVGSSSVGGSGGAAVRVRTQRNASASRLAAAAGTPYDVTLSVTSSHPGIWEEYFEERLGSNCSTSGDTVTCSFTTNRVHVTVIRVEVAM